MGGTDRTLSRDAFRCIVRFYDEAADEGEPDIPEELRAAAESARKEAEEASRRLKPTAGEFRLRGRSELERFFNENVVDIVNNHATLSNENAHNKEEVGCFLKAIQRAAEKHVLVVGMTNLIESIDPAILRTGRMGARIKVDMPSLTEVEDVLVYALDKRPHEDFPLTPYAEQLLNRPLSDVTYAADEAAMHTARARRTRITEADLAAAILRPAAPTRSGDFADKWAVCRTLARRSRAEFKALF